MPAPIRDEKQDVVKSGALRLTWISGAVGGIAALVTVFNEQFVNIFGDNASDGTKAAVLIAIIAAWAAIAVADLLARAITTAAHLRKAPAEAISPPKGMKVTLTDGTDSAGWLVAAIRGLDGSDGGVAEFLVVKSGQKPKWVKQEGLTLDH